MIILVPNHCWIKYEFRLEYYFNWILIDYCEQNIPKNIFFLLLNLSQISVHLYFFYLQKVLGFEFLSGCLEVLRSKGQNKLVGGIKLGFNVL